MQYASYHDLLIEEFERRKQLNESYSLRSYARNLNLSAPRLSKILKKKEGVSVKAAHEIAGKLNLSEIQRSWFCDSVGSLHARSFQQRIQFKEKIKEYKNGAKVFSEIHLEYFKVIADWYHFAILELTYLKEFKNDVQWIAQTLQISAEEARTAIERMKGLELLNEKDGKLTDSYKFLATPNDIPSVSLKKFNTQLMKKAMDALHEQNVLDREIASNIFSISKERLPEFKNKLRDFRREFEHDAGQDKNKDAVYCLSMQFYELTKRDKK